MSRDVCDSRATFVAENKKSTCTCAYNVTKHWVAEDSKNKNKHIQENGYGPAIKIMQQIQGERILR